MTDNGIETLAEALRSPFPVVYLDFRSVDRFLYRIRDLDRLHDGLAQDLIDRLDWCHIYMICKRPRLSLIPNSVTWNAYSVSLKVSCTVNGVTHEGDAQIRRPPELNAAKAFRASPFPHRELHALDHEGNVIQEMLFANIAHLIDTLPSFTKQLEVLYVGKGLSNNAQDRLKNHGTLQKVLADINSDNPESEVFALVFSFDYRRSAGGVVSNGANPVEILRQTTKPYKPTLDDQVSLIEAAAISYFHTEKYNSHYIDFPRTDTGAAQRARKSGVSYIAVQIDTENIGAAPIFSQRTEPQVTHHVVIRIAPQIDA